MSFDVVDVAENGGGLMPAMVALRRDVTPELILLDQPGSAMFRMALRNRFLEHEVDERIAHVRRWFGRGEHDDFTWVVGTRSTPADLADRLLADGAQPAEEDPEMAAMVLTEEPSASDGVEIRVSETFEDILVVRDLTAQIFDVPPENVPTDEYMRGIWEASRGSDYRTFIAYVDGAPAGRATCCPTEQGPFELANAGVLPAYRGRGIYRALVRARWDEAVRRGTPVLVTQAGEMSRPVLERLGFRTVGSIVRLVDLVRHRS
jgi:GNAT superfamily N-acetyltransferase